MATGYYDANGIWRYGESDSIALFSDLLNLGQASNSAAISSDRSRISFLEQSVEQASTFVASSQAARDSYWGIPANATARLELQNKGARTVRTDLGVTQQYFAATTDGGSNPGGREVAGWFMVNNMGQQMIPTSVTAVSGTISANAEGEVSYTSCTAFYVSGVFTNQFRNYTIKINNNLASTGTVLLRWANGGTASASGYFTNGLRAGGGVSLNNWNTGFNVTEHVLCTTDNGYNSGQFAGKIEAFDPKSSNSTYALAAFHSVQAGAGFAMFESGSAQATTQYNGFYIGITAGNMTGNVTVYGWN